MKTCKLNVNGLGAMNDGDMKKVTVSGMDLIIVKNDGRYRVLGGTCPHKGAPLEDGLLARGGILCPWHHARFDADTGELLDGPARDSLSEFDATVDGDTLEVTVPDTPEVHRCVCKGGHDTEADQRTFVILGAGAAGASAAETLRGNGFKGRILMITRENRLPYDRTDLSKGVLAGKSEVFQLRDAEFYDRYDIQVRLKKTVVDVNPDIRKVSFSNGSELHYDKLLLATGSEPIVPGFPGTDLPNVFTIRTPEDVQAVSERCLKASQAMLVGAGFISLECASQLRERGLSVTVIAPETQPFYHVLGHDPGGVFRTVHEDAGVRFFTNTRVDAIEAENDLTVVYMENGNTVTGDFVILGTGVRPSTDYLPGSMKDDDGGVTVDAWMQVPGYEGSVYAAGDLARFPRFGDRHDRIRVEHWRVAEQMGRTAALNMLGRKTPFNRIPFFWTRQQGKGLKYLGHAEQWDDIRILGNLEAQSFAAFYLKKSKIRGVAAMGMGDLMEHIEVCMMNDTMPSIKAIQSGTADWENRVR